MADIRMKSGKAWLGYAGWGIRLKIYGQAPQASPVLLAETPSHDPSLGSFGNGVYAQDIPQHEQYLYLGTNGIGTYKIWAEHPDNPNLKAEDTYYFDPDNYQGSGDAFDWRTDGIVPDLVIPTKHFIVSGDMLVDYDVDELHLVVDLSNPCSVSVPNFTIPVTSGNPWVADFSRHFALPTQAATTFYVYARDHTCNSPGLTLLH